MTGSYTAPPELLALLRQHEGDMARAYRDTRGIWTAGVGRNLENPGLTKQEVIGLLQIVDIPEPIRTAWLTTDAENIAHQVAGVVGDDVWPALAPARQAALIDVGFAGPAKLALFVNMLAAVRSQDWQRAHDELLDSKWAVEVKQARASCDADMLLTGDFPNSRIPEFPNS